VVDGNDLLAVHRAVRRAAERARRGEGPTLLEFQTFRMRGHEEASGTDYVPREQVEDWAKKDPVRRYEAFLVEKGLFAEGDFATIRAAYKARIDALADEALEAPEPRSTVEEKLADVFAPSLLVPKPAPPRRRRGSCATSTRSATACARPCAQTTGSCCSGRTSPSTAGSSR